MHFFWRRVYVWLYDGTNICFEKWQIMVIILSAFYAIPFPFTLFLGLRLLKQNKISHIIFICSCLFPVAALLPMLIYILIKKDSNFPQTPSVSEEAQVIVSCLQGPYENDKKHSTLYWEAMVSVRRLIITAMTLLGNHASIQMIMITILCLIFLIQHIYMRPFQVRASNSVETLSSSLLVIASVINLLKASLTDSGVIPSGPVVPFFKSLELSEKLFVLLIIGYIVLVELKLMKGKTGKYIVN